MKYASYRFPVSFTALSLFGPIAALSFWPSAGVAATQNYKSPTVSAVLNCRTMDDAEMRLACFDAASKRLDEAIRDRRVKITDLAKARQEAVEQFGQAKDRQANSKYSETIAKAAEVRSKPAVRGKATIDDSGHIKSVLATVASARRDVNGRWIVDLGRQGVWRQTDSRLLGRSPQKGSTVEIKRAAFGSFKMKIDGGPAFRVRRER